MDDRGMVFPLGSICLTKNSTLNVIIVGINSGKTDDKSKDYDYIAFEIEDNMDMIDKKVYLKHDDIIKLIHKGYSVKKNSNINKLTVSEKKSTKAIKFDENGVVVFETLTADYKNENDTDSSFTQNNNNPFIPTYKNISRDGHREEPEGWPIFKNIEFDENGIIISTS